MNFNRLLGYFRVNEIGGLDIFDFAIIGISPVPYLPDIQVEGGGARSWGIAQALALGKKKVILLVPQDLASRTVELSENLVLMKYSAGDDLSFAKNLADTLIIHGSHWNTSQFFTQRKKYERNPIIIVDGLVPINIEYACRAPLNSNKLTLENFENSYKALREASEKIFSSSDYVLCGGENQLLYYQGLLSNGGTYTATELLEKRILNFPHLILPSSQRRKSNISQQKIVLGWFGGLYPWIAPEYLPTLFSALLERNEDLYIKIIGPINGFIAEHELVQQHARKILAEILASKHAGRIHIVEWVHPSKINDELAEITAILTLNPSIVESKLSWRTRFVDLINAQIPIITDGLDQFSQELIKMKAATQITGGDISQICLEIEEIVFDSSKIEIMKCAMGENRAKFTYAFDPELFENLTHRANCKIQELESPSEIQNVWRIRLGILLNLIYRFKVKTIFLVVAGFLNRRALKFWDTAMERVRTFSSQKILYDSIIITPDIGLGGANLVAIDLMDDFKKAEIPITLTFDQDINLSYFKTLNRPYTPIRFSQKLFNQKLKLLVINSVMHPLSFWIELENALDANESLQVYLYVHEDNLSMFIDQAKQGIIDGIFVKHLKRIEIATPSLGTQKNIAEFFNLDINNITRHIYPMKNLTHIRKNSAKEFDATTNIKFILIGTSSDSRKNHRTAIDIFATLSQMAKTNYRNWELTFVGMGSDPYSLETIEYGKSKLNEKMNFYGEMHHEEVLKLMNDHHVLLSISEFETLSKVVTEALVLGLLIVRNGSSGMEEQLVDGENGYKVDEKFVLETAKSIHELLDPVITSLEKLSKMSTKSMELGKILAEKAEIDSRNFIEKTMEKLANEAK
jgi:glycosyltransferase involved in cell wall biosynthesis